MLLMCLLHQSLLQQYSLVFSKYGTRLHQISLFQFKILRTQCDWRFVLIQIFNNRECFKDVLEI